MKKTRLVPFVAVVCLLLPIAGLRADSLQVQFGYADTLRARFFLPTPWCGSLLTHFDGSSSNDGCSQIFDAGAIRLINLGSMPVTVTDVTVTIGSSSYDLWNEGGPFQIQPGASEILSQLTPNLRIPDDFDTSDASNAGCCTNDGIIPTITISFDGTTHVFLDSDQVLNTGGFDKGLEGNEGSPWQSMVSTLEPSALALSLTGFVGLGFYRWRRKACLRS